MFINKFQFSEQTKTIEFSFWVNMALKEHKNCIIILKGKKLEAFLLRSGTSQGCSLSLLLFQHLLEVLPDAKRKEKVIKVTIKGTKIEKEKINLSVHR